MPAGSQPSRRRQVVSDLNFCRQMACCGLDGYQDYYSMFYTQADSGFNQSWYPDTIHTRPLFEAYNNAHYYRRGRDLRQIPSSCCKPIWQGDIYCADNILHYDTNALSGTGVSLAKERLNQRVNPPKQHLKKTFLFASCEG